MEAHFSTLRLANLRTSFLPNHEHKTLNFLIATSRSKHSRSIRRRFEVRVSNGDSYLDMWKKAVVREKQEIEFQKIAEKSIKVNDEEKEEEEEESNPEVLEKKSEVFNKILQVPKEERDRVQRMQVIDRAAAAIAAAKSLIKETPPTTKVKSSDLETLNQTESNNDKLKSDKSEIESNGTMVTEEKGTPGEDEFGSQSDTLQSGTPGPDFWSWTPPPDDNISSKNNSQMSRKPAASPQPAKPVMEKELSLDYLTLPFESTSVESHNPPLPPLQSIMQVENLDLADSKSELHTLDEKQELGMKFSVNAEEAAEALLAVEEASCEGVKPDGSKWWKETGVETRPNGVVCRWTLTRGVSADKSIEWEEKFWEAADQFEYKELGSEKSGRDATGNVWREYWKESMWQDAESGLMNMEKTADKWGKNGKGDEWHEKWWEHYDASGQAEKWAHKWCSIDPNTPLEAGHAHVWHERWGEKYDGQGSSIKYTDKWAERLEGDGWTKWGDKWDENFNQYSQGVKQGETWWQGKHGERWNRTWGEGHNGSGWVHKYGKSSCGEHWDTHVQQDTWYERFPHFGFQHCFENSRQLREVRKPPETS
ncbi:hypothetical protein AQUCO_01700559v1 [Aquilegia coerulea]|uniref:Uncharacterized protein n=1 Tax=Aquilegia coerulea TaxID=218851 RepID=A0A2G5DNL3_AQUCA|nr:hypothetical protein AQUCO_01700559v1 [Aquilegia coerulea]